VVARLSPDRTSSSALPNDTVAEAPGGCAKSVLTASALLPDKRNLSIRVVAKPGPPWEDTIVDRTIRSGIRALKAWPARTRARWVPSMDR
jgi:hypothetical protein